MDRGPTYCQRKLLLVISSAEYVIIREDIRPDNVILYCPIKRKFALKHTIHMGKCTSTIMWFTTPPLPCPRNPLPPQARVEQAQRRAEVNCKQRDGDTVYH